MEDEGTKYKQINNANYSKLELRVKQTQVWANCIIICQVVLIFIALVKYNEAKSFNIQQIENNQRIDSIAAKNELSKYAIEAINKIYNNEFLISFAKFDENSILTKETRDAFILVLNNYYIVAVMYNNGIANNELIEESIKSGVLKFTSYQVYKSINDENIESAKKAIDEMIGSFNLNNK